MSKRLGVFNAAHADRFTPKSLALKDEFIRHEMPASFVEDLTAAINELEAAAGEQSASKGALKQPFAERPIADSTPQEWLNPRSKNPQSVGCHPPFGYTWKRPLPLEGWTGDGRRACI